jgi:hypothetical protein
MADEFHWSGSPLGMDSVCPALKVPHLGAGVPAYRGAGVPGCRGALWAGQGRAGSGRRVFVFAPKVGWRELGRPHVFSAYYTLVFF